MNAGKNERPGTVTEGRSEEDQGKIALAKNYDEIKKYLKENEKRAKGQNGFGRADAAYMTDGAMAESSVAESTKDMQVPIILIQISDKRESAKRTLLRLTGRIFTF